MDGLDRLYRWIISHRGLAGVLLLLGAMVLWQVLVNPFLPLIISASPFEGSWRVVGDWLQLAQAGLVLIGLAAIWLIGASYLLKSAKAFREEEIGTNLARRPLFLLKRAAVFLFLVYMVFAIAAHAYLYQPLDNMAKVGLYAFLGLAAAAIFVAGIALLATLAQQSRRYWKIE